MNGDVPVLTIDGPSGSGKGTVSRAIASRLGWHFLDSGAIYRALALAALARNIDLGDVPALSALGESLDLAFEPTDPPVVRLDGQDVGDRLGAEECGNAASRVAQHPEVRKTLLQRQRDFLRSPGLVADGRDMGTVVFPEARHKIFLTASPEVRAVRRLNQLKERGADVSLNRLIEEIEERDRRDLERETAPLRMAEGALFVDSSELGVEEVIEVCLDFIKEPR
jgi:cytidylate kinase